MGWEYRYVPACYGNELHVRRKHSFMSVLSGLQKSLLSDVCGPWKCESAQKTNREIQWKMVCEILKWKSMESAGLAVAGGSGRASWRRVGCVCTFLSLVLGGWGLCWPFHCCPVKAGLEQKWSLTWVQLLKSEFEDKLCFLFFFLVCACFQHLQWSQAEFFPSSQVGARPSHHRQQQSRQRQPEAARARAPPVCTQ